jgi:LacI family transcriptional regulator
LISLSGQTTHVEHLKELHTKGMPIVFFDRFSDEINTHKVVADNYKGAFEGTEHLINSGKKHIAHLAASPTLSITRERINGYKAALEKHGIPYNEDFVKYCNFSIEDMEKVIDELLSQPILPEAIFTVSDRLAMACLKILKKRNIRIPEDMALMGFSNLKVAELLSHLLHR